MVQHAFMCEQKQHRLDAEPCHTKQRDLEAGQSMRKQHDDMTVGAKTYNSVATGKWGKEDPQQSDSSHASPTFFKALGVFFVATLFVINVPGIPKTTRRRLCDGHCLKEFKDDDHFDRHTWFLMMVSLGGAIGSALPVALGRPKFDLEDPDAHYEINSHFRSGVVLKRWNRSELQTFLKDKLIDEHGPEDIPRQISIKDASENTIDKNIDSWLADPECFKPGKHDEWEEAINPGEEAIDGNATNVDSINDAIRENFVEEIHASDVEKISDLLDYNGIDANGEAIVRHHLTTPTNRMTLKTIKEHIIWDDEIMLILLLVFCSAGLLFGGCYRCIYANGGDQDWCNGRCNFFCPRSCC